MGTVLPAKSDSGFMLVYKVIRDLESIYHLCINPILRISNKLSVPHQDDAKLERT